MERLQAAIEKARAQRGEVPRDDRSARQVEPISPPVPQTTSVDMRRQAWAALGRLEVRPSFLSGNRVISQSSQKEAQAFDLLRTRVRQQMRAQNWTRMAVISPHAGAGKTTTLANLGFALGRQSELTTMVMDFDLRRPSLGRTLGQSLSHNMSQVIAGELDFAAHGLRHGDNLAFGLNHTRAENSSELLQSSQTEQWIRLMEEIYAPDLMLFDMPPIMGSDDSLGFLNQVHCALIVVEAEVTPITQMDAIERQVAQQTNVLGIVLNKCSYADGEDFGDYGYY